MKTLKAKKYNSPLFLFILLTISSATSKHFHGISYEDFSEILSSEVDMEVEHMGGNGIAEWWDDVIEMQWNIALNMVDQSTRYLRNDVKTESIGEPFVICNSNPHGKGLLRIEEIRKVAEVERLSILLNNDERTCVTLEINPRKAEELEIDDYNYLSIIPYTGGMKIRRGVMECLLNEGTSYSCGRDSVIELDVELFDGRVNDDEIVQHMSHRITNKIHSHHNRKLSLNRFDLAYRKGNNLDPRSLMWQHVSETENICDLSGIDFNRSDDSSIMEYIVPLNKLEQHCALSLLVALSQEGSVQSISVRQPIELFNTEAQWIVQSGIKNERPWFDSDLSGKNQIVAVSDTGLDMDNCYFWDATGQVQADNKGKVDLSRRKVVQYYTFIDDSDEELGHGTHVTGTIAGRKAKDGKTETPGYADGVAKSAKIAFFDIGDSSGNLYLPSVNKLLEPGFDAGAMIHSASWGRKSDYSILAKGFDNFIYKNEDFIAITAAGNMGGNGPSIIEPGNAKNVITVGASQSDGRDLYWYDKGFDYVAYFSSHGPVNNRIKPDIVAPGRTLLSAGARPKKEGECDDTKEPKVGENIKNSIGLAFSQGTSMATPVVSGVAALVRQYFIDGFYPTGLAVPSDSFVPSGALIKAVILNGGVELAGVDKVNSISPSSHYDGAQGFGRVSLIDSLPLSGKNGIKAHIIDRKNILLNDQHRFQVSIKKNSQCDANVFSATLVWMDPPAAIGCKSCVLNDLDLYIKDTNSGIEYYPNGHTSKDFDNNVERIRIDAKDSDRFEISVFASNLATSSQKYSLVVTGCLNDGDDTSPSITPSPIQSPVQSPISDGVISLQTDVDSNDRSPGFMFDVTAKDNDITIESFDIVVNSQSNLVVAIYSKIGSHIGSETSSSDWEKIGSVSVTGAGLGRKTHIPSGSFDTAVVNRNKVRAFFITITSTKEVILRCQKVNEASFLIGSDSNLTITGGTGIKELFKKEVGMHAFTGNIYYKLGTGANDSINDDNSNREADSNPHTSLNALLDPKGKTGTIGHVFDVEASVSLMVTSLGVLISSKGTCSIQIYTKVGSYVGYEEDSSKWTNLINVNVISSGPSSITKITGFNSLSIPKNGKRSFYVTSSSKDLIYSKVNDKNAIIASNNDMSIPVGSLTKKLFDKASSGMGWNGVIYYEVQSSTIP